GNSRFTRLAASFRSPPEAVCWQIGPPLRTIVRPRSALAVLATGDHNLPIFSLYLHQRESRWIDTPAPAGCHACVGSSFALIIAVAALSFLVLAVVIGVTLLLGGPAAAGYLAAREDSAGWRLVEGLMALLLAVYFGWIALHDARIALTGGPFRGIEWPR